MSNISAIIPALNEEKTIGAVVKTVLDSRVFSEVLVVDGASKDKTAEIARSLGARVIVSTKRDGKGMAMKRGAQESNGEIIMFFDADLIGLTKEHINLVIEPVVNGMADMSVGARGHYFGLPYLICKIDPLLAIGGERAMVRGILENIPEKFIQGFAVETMLNYYCRVKKIKVKIINLPGLRLVPKEKKWGLMVGFKERVKEVGQLIKIRFIILFSHHEFK